MFGCKNTKILTEIGFFFRNNDGSKAMNATGDVQSKHELDFVVDVFMNESEKHNLLFLPKSHKK